MYPSAGQPIYSTDPHPSSVPHLSEPPRYSTDSHHYASISVSGIPSPSLSMHFPSYMIPSMPAPVVTIPPGQWSTGLCHCCDDPANCLTTAFCPCITFGQIAEILNRGSPPCTETGAFYGLLLAFTGFACLYSCFYRSKLRAQYDLQEEPCGDCLVHFCCETCALCQEYRELKKRGFDMGIGWEANMDRIQRGVTEPPIVVPGMRR